MTRGKFWSFTGLTLLAALLATAYTLWAPRAYTYKGSLIEPELRAQGFTLANYDGRPFTLSEQRGRVLLLFFGYSNCPDVCPATLFEFTRIKHRLGEQAADVGFVFITVDPERDTPQRLRDYVGGFDPGFWGLSGSLEELAAVSQSYFVFSEKEYLEPPEHSHEEGEDHTEEADYLVAHTSRIFLVDQNGRLLLTFPYGMDVAAIVQDIQHLLAQ